LVSAGVGNRNVRWSLIIALAGRANPPNNQHIARRAAALQAPSCVIRINSLDAHLGHFNGAVTDVIVSRQDSNQEDWPLQRCIPGSGLLKNGHVEGRIFPQAAIDLLRLPLHSQGRCAILPVKS